MCTSYSRSTVAFGRRLPDEHFNKEEPELFSRGVRHPPGVDEAIPYK